MNKAKVKTCPIVGDDGLTCGRPAVVLDHTRTTGYPAVYICQSCFEREFPELQPKKPPLPEAGTAIFGGQYAGGLLSKPMRDPRRRWSPREDFS